MGISSFFNSTVVVQQSTVSQTAMGGTKMAFSIRVAELPCRLRPLHQSETDLRGKMSTVGMWRLYCAADTDGLSIEVSDRITYGSRLYQVKTIHNPGQLNRHLEIDILEID